MYKKPHFLVLIFQFILSMILTVTAYAGMDDVKEALESSSKTAIVSNPSPFVTFSPDAGIKRLKNPDAATKPLKPFGLSSKPAVSKRERAPLDPAFSQVADLAAEQIKTKLPNLAISVVDQSTLPQKKIFGRASTDWKSTDFEAFIDVTTVVRYSGFPGLNDKRTYSLEADLVLYLKKRNKKGKFEIIRPNMMGGYRLARVNEKVLFNGSATTSPKTLEQLMKALPPESIIENMKSQIPDNVNKFVAEMGAVE